jgi:hypothetical protein
VFVVNITSAVGVPSNFSPCLIQPGEHSFIEHQSAVAYGRAAVLAFSAIEAGLRVGAHIAKEKVSSHLLKRIQDGARGNIDIPTECEEYIQYF